MGPGRQSSLRDLFDDAPTPLIGHPPRTHHLDYYAATDGSYRDGAGGIGAVLETADGRRIARLSKRDASPDNNVAEYRALHYGLDVLAARIPASATVGVVVDHVELARNVNAYHLALSDPRGDAPVPLSIPAGARHHWRGIMARMATLDTVRAARIDGGTNPAHPLANEPDAYRHLLNRPDRCELPGQHTGTERRSQIPPPSRARTRSSD